MRARSRHTVSVLRFPLLGIGLMLLLAACETDLAEVDRIASIQEEVPVDISYGITVIYSDSAKVKAQLTSEEMRQYSVDDPYIEFQKGITLILFDENGEESQRITSDYARQFETRGITEFKNNVVVTLASGAEIHTEEVIRDENENIYYNQVPITYYSPDRLSNFQGSSFRADGDFDNIDVENSTFLYTTPPSR